MSWEYDVKDYRERFPRAVVRLCEVFGAGPARQKGFIRAYWEALETAIAAAEFETMAVQFARRPNMAVKTYLPGTNRNHQAVKLNSGSKYCFPGAREGEEDKAQVLGTRLIDRMNMASYETLRRTAKILVDESLGHFRNTITPRTYSVMVEYKMKQIAAARYYRKGKEASG